MKNITISLFSWVHFSYQENVDICLEEKEKISPVSCNERNVSNKITSKKKLFLKILKLKKCKTEEG